MFPAQDTSADPNRKPDLEPDPDLSDTGIATLSHPLPGPKNGRDIWVLVCVWV